VNWGAVAAGEQRVRVRKKPGPYNPMGRMKFSFADSADIYLHDTPEKELFSNPQRTLSLGCVRVEDAPRLAQWLLRADPVAPSGAPENHVQLAQGVPVYLTYLTARMDGAQLSFAPDIYSLDGGELGLASSR
jgi:murein L,D-transpeptidase YcbB/YkuD